MDQYEVPLQIAEELPAIRKKIIYLSALGDILETIHIFTLYTFTELRLHHVEQVQKCMALASRLYEHGNQTVRDALENVFVHFFSVLQTSCTDGEWQQIISVIPPPLYAAYVRQVTAQGC
jgi:hypothetical protein